MNLLYKHPILSEPATKRHWKRCRSSLLSSCKAFGMPHLKQLPHSFGCSPLPIGRSVVIYCPDSKSSMVFWNSSMRTAQITNFLLSYRWGD